MTEQTAVDLYLDLLAHSLTATLYDREPNHHLQDKKFFVLAFTKHYIHGPADTMLPRARLDNIRRRAAGNGSSRFRAARRAPYYRQGRRSTSGYPTVPSSVPALAE